MEEQTPLAKIHQPPIPLSKEPDNQTRLELQHILQGYPEYLAEKIKQEKARTQKLEEEINSLQEDRKARKKYGYAVFCFVAMYIFILGGFLWMIASHHNYQLSDNVLITLLASTSINIIGLLMGVVRYLFPGKPAAMPNLSK